MLLTNRGKPRDTWEAWDFYREVRGRYGPWDHVELTFTTNPHRHQSSADTVKLVRFVDEHAHTLELYGVNFGYDGGTPGEVVDILVREGFSKSIVTEAVYNLSGAATYPQTIKRSGSALADG